MSKKRTTYSQRLFWLLILVTLVTMSVFIGIRFFITTSNLNKSLKSRAENIAYRVGGAVAPTVWEIYQKSQNREYSEELVSSIIGSEFNDPYVIGIIVYGNFGHVFMARFRNEEGSVVDYSSDLHDQVSEVADQSAYTAIKTGTMTTGNVRVYLTSKPNAELMQEVLIVELIQSLSVSALFVVFLFVSIRRVLISPMRSLAIADQTMDSLVEAVMVTDESGIVVDVNPAFSRLLNRDVKQCIGASPDLRIEETDTNSILKNIWNGDVQERTWTGEFTLIHSKKERIAVHASISPVLSGDASTGHTVTLLRDITLQKKAEKALLKTNTELETANAELGEFAYRSSHDLRSPLVSSIGIIGMSKELMDRGQYDDASQCLTQADGSLRKLDTLVKDILHMTELGSMREVSEPVDLNFLVHECIQSASYLDDFKEIDFVVEVATDPIVLQRIRLQNVLENLISNVVKYHDPDEENSFAKITSRLSSTHFFIEVEDNGLGIKPKYHQNVFTMFRRFHPKVSQGSGLGLYLIKRSIESMGGQISYHGIENGSKFSLVIPLSKEDE